jgi:hypothetical protein
MQLLHRLLGEIPPLRGVVSWARVSWADAWAWALGRWGINTLDMATSWVRGHVLKTVAALGGMPGDTAMVVPDAQDVHSGRQISRRYFVSC